MGATVVFLLYCGMIASVPVLLFSQSAIGGGIVSIFAAVAMAIVAATSVSRTTRGERSPAPSTAKHASITANPAAESLRRRSDRSARSTTARRAEKIRDASTRNANQTNIPASHRDHTR